MKPVFGVMVIDSVSPRDVMVISASGSLDMSSVPSVAAASVWGIPMSSNDIVNASTEEVHCYVALAGSNDGKGLEDYGYVLSWNDPSVWGYGDEIFPLGAYYANGRYNVYYGAKGRVGAWKLGVATGSRKDRVMHTRAVLTNGQIIGGCDPVFISEDRIALFVGREMVAKDIPTTEAADRLVQLIREHGRWTEPDP